MIGLANAARDGDCDLSKPRAQRRRALLLVRLAHVDDLPLALDVLLAALGSPQGELPRQQVVAGVAIGDLYSLAALAQIVDVLSQNDFHACLISAGSWQLAARNRQALNLRLPAAGCPLPAACCLLPA